MSKGKGKSKNANAMNKKSTTLRYVTGDECKTCERQCALGKRFLAKLAAKGASNCPPCPK